MSGVSQFKTLNTAGSGQKANTRIRDLFTRFKQKITLAANRYRAARECLVRLQPGGEWMTRLLVLHDNDISGPGRNDEGVLGEGHHEMS